MPSSARTHPGAAMATAAAAFLDSLDARQRAIAQMPLRHTQMRHDWHYFPRDDRPGLHMLHMTDEQRQAARGILLAGLSERGAWQADCIMHLEDHVRLMEDDSRYQPLNYGLVLFGRPGDADAPWGWRFEGHHLSLTMVVMPDGTVTVTPLFMGANPAVVGSDPVHGGGDQGLEVLAEETSHGFALLHGLEPTEREQALIRDRSMGDILTGPGRETAVDRREGLSVGRLNEARRDGVIALVRAYADRLRPDLAERELVRLGEAGLDGLTFAWAGSTEPGAPHYYRLAGPTLIIEYDNTQDDANHIHTVWHDPTGRDFGDDPLRRHYDHGHHADGKRS